MPFPEHTVTKTVPLKFFGTDLRFKLSHALFSSHKIDDGTMLLLKTLAQKNVIPHRGRVLDAGCGVGPLAICLKKKVPELEVTAQDRLALACVFTEENARINKVDVKVIPGLLLRGVDGPWDLLVSNLPAKAGEPVLADFFERACDSLATEGVAAVVIVKTLASWAEEGLARCGAVVIYREDAPEYSVFHFRRAAEERKESHERSFVQVYRRTEMAWNADRSVLNHETFWGLPNFDSLDYRIQVSLPLMEKQLWKGPVLVWNPGQGHLAALLARRTKNLGEIYVSGNDLLGLLATKENLVRMGYESLSQVHVAGWGELMTLPSATFRSVLVNLESHPEIPWVEETLEALVHLTALEGVVLVNGTSTELSRLLEKRKGLRILSDQRYRGWRAAVLFRQSS